MKIAWADIAITDLEAIRDYIAKDSEYYASEFIERILDAVSTLKDLPKIGRIVPEAGREDIGELLFHNYRIIYHVGEERVFIIAVIHCARELSVLKPKPWEII